MPPAPQDLLLGTAERRLLEPYALEAGKLERVFGALGAHRIDYADLYFQYARPESWSLEEGIVKSGSFNIEQGVGVVRLRLREGKARRLRSGNVPTLDRPIRFTVVRGKSDVLRAASLEELAEGLERLPRAGRRRRNDGKSREGPGLPVGPRGRRSSDRRSRKDRRGRGNGGRRGGGR